MTVVTFVFIIIIITVLISKYKRRFQLGMKIPGPMYVPFIGNLKFATMKPESVFIMVNELRQKYNQCFRLWLGPKLWIFLHTPEQTKDALNNSSLSRAADFQLLRPLIGNGLLISEGKIWSTRRKALNPAFISEVLENFLEPFSRQADVLVDCIAKYNKIEITNYLFLCILDIICETSMGAIINCQIDPLGIYGKAFHDASHLLFKRMVNPLYSFDFIYKLTREYKKLMSSIKVIHDLTDKVIKERRKIIQKSCNQSYQEFDYNGKKRNNPLLDTLLSINIDGQLLGDNDIKDEVNTFLFAGVDTTKSALSFIFYNIAKYKDVQDKLYHEISTIISNKNEVITMPDLNKMHYLDLVIKESLRLHTTVPLTGRQTLKDTKIHDILVPENSTVWINMYGLAHDSNLFVNPDKFCPERFDKLTSSSSSLTVPYSYLPFSGGLHMCIGKRYSMLILKVVTVKIILNYELSLVNPEEELILIAEMVLKSKNGINLNLKKRNT